MSARRQRPIIPVATTSQPHEAAAARPAIRTYPSRDPVRTNASVNPTITALAGIKAPSDLAGRSLVPLLRDPLAKWDGFAVTQVLRPADRQPQPPLRLLPIWDTLFVSYKDRSRFLAPEHYQLAYDKDGNATSVILADGMAAGQWNLGSDDPHLEIRIAPFDRFTAAQRKAIGDEADRIGGLIGSETVTVVECAGSVDLVQAKRNRFMSPLKYAAPR